MRSFDYQAVQTVDQAVALLNEHGAGARILSGGTDLILQLREGRLSAALLVDIKPVPETNLLSYDPEQGLRIGAAVPCLKISSDEGIAALYPGLVDAVALIGGIQIRSRATLGGNLCNASPAADSIPALIVHQAVCLIAGPLGRREAPAEGFCTAPGKTCLGPGEFLVSLRLPPPPPHFGASYLRFTPRAEMDIAVVGAGAAVTLTPDGSRFVSARIALGAVAPTPLFVPEAGQALQGQLVSPDAIERAARIAQQAARPISDLRGTSAQRKHLCAVLVRRALERALQRTAVQPKM